MRGHLVGLTRVQLDASAPRPTRGSGGRAESRPTPRRRPRRPASPTRHGRRRSRRSPARSSRTSAPRRRTRARRARPRVEPLDLRLGADHDEEPRRVDGFVAVGPADVSRSSRPSPPDLEHLRVADVDVLLALDLVDQVARHGRGERRAAADERRSPHSVRGGLQPGPPSWRRRRCRCFRPRTGVRRRATSHSGRRGPPARRAPARRAAGTRRPSQGSRCAPRPRSCGNGDPEPSAARLDPLDPPCHEERRAEHPRLLIGALHQLGTAHAT